MCVTPRVGFENKKLFLSVFSDLDRHNLPNRFSFANRSACDFTKSLLKHSTFTPLD